MKTHLTAIITAVMLVCGITTISGNTRKALPGVFSVGEDKYVRFSPGNLQYNAAKGTHRCADGTTQQGTWRFAEHQWDFAGNATQGTVYENDVKCDNSKISETYNGWIDLFSWGTSGWNSGANEYQPWATSGSDLDYTVGMDGTISLTGDYRNADWSVYNEIDGDSPGTWRCLTSEESKYLLCSRPDAEKLFGFGTVNGVCGVILLPDNWATPDGLTFVASTDKGMTWRNGSNIYASDDEGCFDHNVYTDVQWEQMEDAGAVFLPAAGYRQGRYANNQYMGTDGNYWLSTAVKMGGDKPGATYIDFPPNSLWPQRRNYRYQCFSVRPVKETIVRTYVPRPFSVSADRQITFSPGNLQYNATLGCHQCADGTTQQGTWRFAEHQWDFVGDATQGTVYEDGIKCDNSQISETYNGWIDLFGWGTSGWNSGAVAYQPWATSETNSDYYPGGSMDNDLTGSYAYADWGVYNEIDGDAPETWRTLTKDEWVYLVHERKNAEQLFGMGTVNGINGIILLPDDRAMPEDLTFTSSTESGMEWQGEYYESESTPYSDNIYTLPQWEKMEAAGAVFLPAAGCRSGSALERENGRYWSSTQASENGAYYFRFHTTYLYPQYYYNRNRGFSVRLVKDAVVLPTYVPKPFSVSADKQITFSPGNLQYNAAKGTHFCADGTTQQGTWRFAEHQWSFVGDAEVGNVYADGVKSNNALVSAGYNGWIDLFGWGTSGWNSGANAYRPYDTSTDNNDYNPGGNAYKDITGEFAFADWGIYNHIENATAGIWRSLTLQEWFYLLCYRTDAKKLFGLGNVEGVNGLILLPDDWTTPPDVTFTPSTEKGLVLTEDGYQNPNKDNYSHNPYTYAQWQKIEAAGAVFLPAGGRFGEDLTNSPVYGLYWTSTNAGAKYACRSWFDNKSVYPGHGADRCIRHCVRPVMDMPASVTLWLYDNHTADRYASLLDEYKYMYVNIILMRRFRKDLWTTLALPFTLETLEGTPLDGCLFEMTGATADNTNGIVLHFISSDKMEADKPYIVRLAEDADNLTFNGVRLLSFDEKPVTVGDETGDVVEFRPVMAPTRITERTSLYLNNNRLWYANQTSGNRLRAFRAYMELLHPERISYIPVRVSINGIQTDIEVAEGDSIADEPSASPARKYVENGILIIERNGRRYTATGIQLP